LSLEGLRGGHFWQLLTFQFLHGGFVHLFLNSWAIFVFGRPVESALGKGRMLSLYFLSGIFGGLVQMALAWFLPETFGAPIVGASAGAFGLVAAFAVMFPDQPLLLLVAFVIPVKMRARTMLWVSVAIAVLGILAVVLKIWQSNIGHAAHLGGIAVGFALAHWFSRGYRSRPIIGLPGRIVR
jgi:membrane associated rhomboid family serine protease